MITSEIPRMGLNEIFAKANPITQRLNYEDQLVDLVVTRYLFEEKQEIYSPSLRRYIGLANNYPYSKLRLAAVIEPVIHWRIRQRMHGEG